jgi:hypothetical protein
MSAGGGVMQIRKIGWVGTKTTEARAMAELFGQVMGIPFEHGDEDFWVFRLPDGGKVEVFGPRADNPHFTTGPVPGFLVDDVAAATEELRSARVPILTEPTGWEGGDDVWMHFRAPDGNVYELTHGGGLASPPS